MQVLGETSRPGLRYYKNYTDTFDDPNDLCIALSDYIDPEMRRGEGRSVPHGLLENVRWSREGDGEIFDGVGGYLDYVCVMTIVVWTVNQHVVAL